MLQVSWCHFLQVFALSEIYKKEHLTARHRNSHTLIKHSVFVAIKYFQASFTVVFVILRSSVACTRVVQKVMQPGFFS